MSPKTKIQLFMMVTVAATVLALAQGLMMEGPGRVVPLVLGGLGILSLVMWGVALRTSRRE
ncbi:hypothetical protein [Streptomyces omiyaensis]|uniref:Secreted protein n=1 Tax=Streptomyces omiyaensis TaxID=68247 RepID=A0ABW7C199_9ACTN|nr:hypothetical protein [Streptomyces omiyaensis]GGY61841.1 hypothetical protein GCM10010363_49160 [Streptomyces omiyaensis]